MNLTSRSHLWSVAPESNPTRRCRSCAHTHTQTHCNTLGNSFLLMFHPRVSFFQAPVLNIDLAPTILDIGGVNLSSVNMDGQSFLAQMVSLS